MHTLTLRHLCKGIMTGGADGFGRLSSLTYPRHTLQLVLGLEQVTWQRFAILKRPEVKCEPGFQIIFSDWLTLTFSEMNY